MIGKKRGRSYPVYTYNPKTKKKEYVGSRTKLADAKELEALKEREFKKGIPAKETARTFAARWLEEFHGANTPRPAETTRKLNESSLKPFLEAFGDRYLSDISRREALAFARKRPNNAKAVSAMFTDAVNEGVVEYSPFSNLRVPRGEGRRHITPLTEAEVERLGDIALGQWHGYGATVRAWIFFGAWVGARPGEYFALEWDRLDLDKGLATLTRVKGRKQTQDVVVPEAACQAIRDMRSLRRGLVFPSPKGRRIVKGLYRYYWDPVRVAFAAELSPGRWRELFEDRDPGQRDIDLYELRHVCASVLADRGANEFEIAHHLGNSPQVCRETYIHTFKDRTNDRLRQFLDADANVVDLRKASSDG